MFNIKELHTKLRNKNIPLFVLVASLSLAAVCMLLSVTLLFVGSHTVGNGSEAFAMAREFKDNAVVIMVIGSIGSAVIRAAMKRSQNDK